MSDMLRRESLRRQMDLLTLVRDQMDKESEDDYEAWAIALQPLTDRVIHELLALEGGPPYPHPLAEQWWYVPAAAPESEERP